MLFAEIQLKIQNAKMLDFGIIFNQSIELFKKIWIQGLVTVLLSVALAIPFMIIVYLPLIFLGVVDASNPSMIDTAAPLLLLVFVLAYLILIIAVATITIALKAALYRIMFQYDMNVLGKEDYFYFLKKTYLSKTISVGLAYIGISVLATLLCFFPLIYVMVPLNLLIVIYAFNPDFTLSNLIKVSFDLGNKKWFITFGLTLVASFLAEMVGFLLCFIGILATVSFVGIPLYFIYKEVIGFDNAETQQIEENV
ncbi:hypothetical protein [uncultured Psychroserpens sp.]|uniref:hypothetical protein n=1 Tax=uncultured Psychroserpens sp. TaxID=255436 RepID=UPI0026377CA8|nr:hypothetical protein [uncultured Psychroserpens sp.]